MNTKLLLTSSSFFLGLIGIGLTFFPKEILFNLTNESNQIAIGNFMHFSVGAISLIKIVFEVHDKAEIIITLTVIYSFFAICFAYVFLRNPSKLINKK
jgi:hypothetical protein